MLDVTGIKIAQFGYIEILDSVNILVVYVCINLYA